MDKFLKRKLILSHDLSPILETCTSDHCSKQTHIDLKTLPTDPGLRKSHQLHNYKQNPTNRIQKPQTPTKLQNHHRSTNKTHGLAGGEGDLSEASQGEVSRGEAS